MIPRTTERFEIALNTSAGQITTAVEAPTGFGPVTAVVPLIRWPPAFNWMYRHQADNQQTWKGTELLDRGWTGCGVF